MEQFVSSLRIFFICTTIFFGYFQPTASLPLQYMFGYTLQHISYTISLGRCEQTSRPLLTSVQMSENVACLVPNQSTNLKPQNIQQTNDQIVRKITNSEDLRRLRHHQCRLCCYQTLLTTFSRSSRKEKKTWVNYNLVLFSQPWSLHVNVMMAVYFGVVFFSGVEVLEYLLHRYIKFARLHGNRHAGAVPKEANILTK